MSRCQSSRDSFVDSGDKGWEGENQLSVSVAVIRKATLYFSSHSICFLEMGHDNYFNFLVHLIVICLLVASRSQTHPSLQGLLRSGRPYKAG